MIKIDLLREELSAAGLNYYFAAIFEGSLVVRFVEDGLKRLPTTEEQAVIDAVVAAHDPGGLTTAEQLREQVRTVAQSAVGVALDDLTVIQQRALLATLLWKAGALDQNLQVQPLSEWVR